MAMLNPTNRVNYEPNSWGAEGGPREDPRRGFTTYPAQTEDDKRRIRSETFADHYSQARQFYISQMPIEQQHIGDALVFDLGKVEHEDIRERMVSYMLNIDDGLAKTVAAGLGLEALPKAADAALPTRRELKRMLDAGFIVLGAAGTAKTFIEICRTLRFWERETAGGI
jgi:catalase